MNISLCNVRIKSLEFSYGGCPMPLVLKWRLFFSSRHLCVCVCISIFVCVFNPEYSLEELMLKLKLQYFGHLMQTADSLKKSLMLGKIEGRRRGHQRIRWLDGIMDVMDMNLAKFRKWWGTEAPGMLQSMGSQRVGHNWMTQQQHTHIYIYIFTFQNFVNAYTCMCIYTFYIFLSMWWWLVIYMERNLALWEFNE